MRIDLNANVGETSDAGPAGRAGSPKALSPGRDVPETDTAQLSIDRATIQALSVAVLQLPEIRQDRVTALAEQVQKGNYPVQSHQTAEALLTALTTNRAA